VDGNKISNAPTLPDLLLDQLPSVGEIGSVTADSAYDTGKCQKAIAARCAAVIIPPRKNAMPWKPTSPGAIARNQALRTSKSLGRVTWRRWSRYHHQSRADGALHGMGGFAQDLRVPDDLRHVYLADAGVLGFTSAALIVLDTQTRTAREILKDHDTIAPQDWVMRRTDGKRHRIAFGLVAFRVGVNGLEISEDGDWLVYATMSHDSVYRIPTALLNDPSVSDERLAAAVELLGPAPMSDEITLTQEGDVILTDVENAGLMRLSDGTLTTLARGDSVDWADSVTISDRGDIWFTDSRLTALLDTFGGAPSLDTLRQNAPFPVYRLRSNNLF